MRFGFWAANVVATVRTACCGGLTASSPVGVFVQPAAGANAATWYETPNAAAPACSVGDDRERQDAAAREEVAEVDHRAPPGCVSATPTHSTEATFFPGALGGLLQVSACRMDAPEAGAVVEVRLTCAVEGVVRRAVLAGPGARCERVPADAGVGREGLDAAVFALTPLAIRSAYVGIAPSAAYRSMRSGRMPSEAKKMAFSVAGMLGALSGLAPKRPAPSTSTGRPR